MKQILNYFGYFVDKQGNIYSAYRRKGRGTKSYISNELKQLKPSKDKDGYLRIGLNKNNKRYYKFVHRLVLETFIGPCPKNMQACHNNGIKDDNRLENLRWDTPKNNYADRVKHGTEPGLKTKGENHYNNKLTEINILKIRELYKNNVYNQKELARMFNVSQCHISDIINYKKWKYI